MNTPNIKSESYPYAGVPSPQQPNAPFHSEDYLTNSPYPAAHYPYQPYPTNQSHYQQNYYQYPYQNSYHGTYPSPYQGKLPTLAQINPYAPRTPFIPQLDFNQNYLTAPWNQPRQLDRLPPPLRPRPPGQEPPELPPTETNPDKPHPCGQPGCNLRFRRIEHARRHRDGVHFKLKPYSCPYPSCGKKFARSDNLRQHIKSIHRKASVASI